MADETLRGIRIPTNIVRFRIVTREKAETHGKTRVPHEMFSALFETVERHAEGKENEDDPIFGDCAIVDHACHESQKGTGTIRERESTRVRSFDPAFFNLIAFGIEGVETDVGGGISLGFISIRIHIPCFAIDFWMRSECGTRQLSTEIPKSYDQ